MSGNRKAIQQFILIIGLLINLISISLFNSIPGLHLIILELVIPIYLILSLAFCLLGLKTSYQLKSITIGIVLLFLGVLQSWPLYLLNNSVDEAMYFGLFCSTLSFFLLILLNFYHHKKFIVTKQNNSQ
jgi:hypothetical protein